ncbi:SAF domain-containing protein [Cohnella yongneupensis]|uniref:SAF domain-containing protein n=1 Tax=Cohnella yongneupensis TaxID=425006 RepID=A0ABW0R165_9BACL
MNRRKQLAISLCAAVMSGLLVYGVYLLQLKQIKLEETVKVVVPKRFVPVGTILTADDLKTISLPRGAVGAQTVTSVAEAVGMEAAVPLGGEEPLLSWKLDKYRLLPQADEATFQIPRAYVKSISNGIRAGDEVLVYLSGESELAPSHRLFEGEIVVAAVKTAANLEIDDPKNPNLLSMAQGDKESMYASRRDANGAIDSINLNLTESEWLTLDTVCKGGTAKLIIAFQASSIGEKGEGS